MERKHIFFDMDGTLTESRTGIGPDMAHALCDLAKSHDVIVISGAALSQMEKQIPVTADETIYRMPQSGNEARHGEESLWQNILSSDLLSYIEDHITALRHSDMYQSATSRHLIDESDLVERRGGQVSFSMIGHNADLETKKNFDPHGEMRSALIGAFPVAHEHVEARIGGTTCLDYTRVGWNKTGNSLRLIRQNGWNIEQCLYVGDQLYPGGNDAVMRDVMRCIEVSGPTETRKVIQELLEAPM